jgi:hypothetical protein
MICAGARTAMRQLSVLIVASVFGLLACSSTPTPSVQTTSAATAPAQSAAAASPAASPSGMSADLPDLTVQPPTGTLLTAVGRVGEGQVALPELAQAAKNISIRFVCAGNTGMYISDADGSFVLSVSGCDGSTVYGTEFTSSPSDRGLRLVFEPDVSNPSVSWAIAVWAR